MHYWWLGGSSTPSLYIKSTARRRLITYFLVPSSISKRSPHENSPHIFMSLNTETGFLHFKGPKHRRLYTKLIPDSKPLFSRWTVLCQKNINLLNSRKAWETLTSFIFFTISHNPTIYSSGSPSFVTIKRYEYIMLCILYSIKLYAAELCFISIELFRSQGQLHIQQCTSSQLNLKEQTHYFLYHWFRQRANSVLKLRFTALKVDGNEKWEGSRRRQ
jgi:hypothetical protein